MVYQWLVLIHIIGVVAFLLVHGVSWFAAFRLRSERRLERIHGLLNLSRRASRLMYLPFTVVFATGVILGFIGSWWGRLWIWSAIAVGLVLSIAMSALGTLYYDRIRLAVGLQPIYGGKKNPSGTLASAEELNMLLSVSTSRPLLLAAIGIGGLIAIVWLMIFKPF